jgi:hypothetical protein
MFGEDALSVHPALRGCIMEMAEIRRFSIKNGLRDAFRRLI